MSAFEAVVCCDPSTSSPVDHIKLTIDIGGTLTKMCIFVPDLLLPKLPPLAQKLFADDAPQSIPDIDPFVSEAFQRNLLVPFKQVSKSGDVVIQGRLHFVAFRSREIDHVFQFLEMLHTTCPFTTTVLGTGGGMIKHAESFKKYLPGVECKGVDEMKAVTRGSGFFITTLKNEFILPVEEHIPQPVFQNPYPYVFTNIGTGTSIILISSPTKFERITGTILGGGAFYGLSRLLTSYSSFKEMEEAAHHGKASNVNMTVRDIYGESYLGIGLTADMPAGAFGKTAMYAETPAGQQHKRPELSDFNMTEPDVVRCVLELISATTAQLTSLVCDKYSVKHAFFGGSLLDANPLFMQILTGYVAFYSKKQVTPHFLHHESFTGTVGSLLEALNIGEYEPVH